MTLGTMYIARMKVNSKIVRKWFYFDLMLWFALSLSLKESFLKKRTLIYIEGIKKTKTKENLPLPLPEY